MFSDELDKFQVSRERHPAPKSTLPYSIIPGLSCQTFSEKLSAASKFYLALKSSLLNILIFGQTCVNSHIFLFEIL